MRQFLVKLLPFILLPIAALGVGCYALYSAKESFFPIDTVIRSSKPYLIGYAYNEVNYGYVKWRILTDGPKHDVWALGSSRVLQFRRPMFTGSFYNAGYTISSLADARPFLESLPKEKYPECLILSLDVWMFNPAWDKLKRPTRLDKWENSFNLLPTAVTVKQALIDVCKGKIPLRPQSQPDSIAMIGLNATVNGVGFRPDGSMQYGMKVSQLLNNDPDGEDYGFSDTYRRINEGTQRFEYGDTVNPKAFEVLDSLLSFCKREDITLIGFVPPFADAVHRRMQEKGRYAYTSQIGQKTEDCFKRYGFELYDFGTATLCGSDDSEMLDGFHGGERTYAKILAQMLERGSVLQRYCDLNKLEADLRNGKNRYEVY